MCCRTAWSWCALAFALVVTPGCSPHFEFGTGDDGTDLEAEAPLVYRVVAASDLPGDVLQLFFPPEPGLARYVPARVQVGLWAGEWQVTGVRQDAYAKAHPFQVIEEKKPALRGKYLHPAEYGQPEEKGIDYAGRQVVEVPAERPKQDE